MMRKVSPATPKARRASIGSVQIAVQLERLAHNRSKKMRCDCLDFGTVPN